MATAIKYAAYKIQCPVGLLSCQQVLCALGGEGVVGIHTNNSKAREYSLRSESPAIKSQCKNCIVKV